MPHVPSRPAARRLAATLTIGAALAAALAAAPAHAQPRTVCRDTPEGRVCTVQQPIVSGAARVSLAVQQDLGLVTLPGCSATLLNRFWVMTADHCVTSNGKINGPSAPLSRLTIGAAWSPRQAVPTRLVRNWGASGRDVALLFLGAGDLGRANRQLFFVGDVDTTMRLLKFGRGISVYASAGPPAVPAQSDGLYRSAFFQPSGADDVTYVLPANGAGQVGNGGDSGAPDLVTDSRGVTLGIAGVQSTCLPTGQVPGQPPAGTWTWVTAIQSCASAAVGPVRLDILRIVQEGRTGSDDFDDDGRGDLLWHNSATGELQVWLLAGSSRIGRATVRGEDGTPSHVGDPWSVVGSNDMDRDGRPDVVWHNAATGETQFWLMNGVQVRARATVLGETGAPAKVGAPWSIVGTGDMNADGDTDLLWHNAATGETQVWLLRGARVASRATVRGEQGAPAMVGLPWSIVAAADMNRDGRPDLVWHNATTGETQAWLMDGVRVASRSTVRGEDGAAAFVTMPWHIVGSNDFDQDGAGDLLWHNASTGEAQIWFMSGSTVARRASVDAPTDGGGSRVGPPWRITSH